MSDQTCQCGEPTAGAWLCDKCQHTFRWSLVNVAAYADDLNTVLRRQVRYGDQGATKGSIGKSQPLLIDMRFASHLDTGSRLADETRATVVAWTRTVLEDQPEVSGPACIDCLHLSCSPIRRRRHPRDTIGSMVNYLARQFRYVLSQRWAEDMFDEFLDLERRLSWFIDRPPDRWYAGRCSETDETGNRCEVELYATTERGSVKCSGCGTEHSVSHRRDFLLAEAKDVLVTATEAASALLAWTDYDGTPKKIVDLIAYWRDHQTNPLEVADVTSLLGRDRHLYRLGDVQDRLIEHAQREQQRRIQPLTAS